MINEGKIRNIMTKNSKLVFFTEYYYPANNTTSYYLTDIIKTAASVWNGRVEIYTASDLAGKDEILTQENVFIKRFSGGQLNKNSLFWRLLKFAFITMKFGIQALCSVAKGDTVFTVTNPAFMLVFLALLRKIRKFNYILLVYDIFPEALIPAGMSKEGSFSYKLTLAIYNWAYRQVDQLIAIGRDMQDLVAHKTGNADKIVLISNWVDVKEIKPCAKDTNPILKKYGLEKKRVFALAGNMGRTQGLNNLLRAIAMLPKNDSRHFLFMGDGAWESKIQDFIRQTPGIPLIYTGRIPNDLQSAMLNACDVAVISLAAGMYGISVPSKTYFNMAAGKPLLLIADENSEVALLIREHDLGWVVPPGEPDKLVTAIQEIENLSDAELTMYAMRSRMIAEQYFSAEVVLEKYAKLFKNACQR